MSTATIYMKDKGMRDGYIFVIKNVQDCVIENNWIRVTNETDMYVFNCESVDFFKVIKDENDN